MLMITYQKSSQGIDLKLEGRVAGEWVNELAGFWARTASRIVSANLSIDLRDVTYADFQGIRALRTIQAQTSAKLISNSPWTRYLAEEIKSIRQDTVEEQVDEYKGHIRALLEIPGKFFSKLSPEDFNTLMWMACPMSCPPGEVLFREEDLRMESVYLILEGKVMLSINSPDQKQLTYSVAKEGDILGLASALSRTPAEMTAETLDRSRLARIWRKDFLNFLANYPAAYDAVLEEVGEDLQSAMHFRRDASTPSKRPPRMMEKIVWESK